MKSYKLGNRKVRVDPHRSIGKGGEADIYDIGGGQALKIYKTPNHPDFAGEPLEMQAAKVRIRERQSKLPSFPTGLPGTVIVPQELATDPKTGLITGFSMRLLEGADVIARLRQHGYRSQTPSNSIVKIFQGLHDTVREVHEAGVIIGDFNDLNVMIVDETAYLIDADSFQFGRYYCATFTQRFADPLLCDPQANYLMLVKPHNEDSDWYAYASILVQSLVQVDPYGGTYKPANRNVLPQTARPLRRISIFHPDVGYPMNAIQLDVLPDDLLEYLHRVYTADLRGEFPRGLIQSLRWTRCTSCGKEHARAVCPYCAVPAAAVIERVRGTVRSKRVFRTAGIIVSSAYSDGKLMYLYHHDGAFWRETGEMVVRSELKPHMRFRINKDRTYVGMGNLLHVFQTKRSSSEQSVTGKSESGKPVRNAQETRLVLDTYGSLPVYDVTSHGDVRMVQGRLLQRKLSGGYRTGEPEDVYIGSALQNQTMFWTGESFGFGFYRAGQLSRAFVFDLSKRGINDAVEIPRIRGQLMDAAAYLSDKLCWFFTTTKEGQHVINRVAVITSAGTVIAVDETDEGDGSWLGSLRGKTAVGTMLLSATDAGLVRVDVSGTTPVVTREFPDTKGFVHAGNNIIPGDGGLFVVARGEITHMTIE